MALFCLSTVLIVITALNILICRRIYAPPIIIGAVFLFSYLCIELAYGKLENGYWFYGCYVLAVCFFSVGFYLVQRKSEGRICLNSEAFSFVDRKYLVLKSIAYLSAAGQICLIIPVIIKTYDGNLWSTVREHYSGNAVAALMSLYVQVLVFVSFYLYIVNNTPKNRRRFLEILPCLLPFMLVTHRGEWFMVIITLTFEWLIGKRISNIKAIKCGFLVVIALVVLIAISSIWKFRNDFSSNKALFESILRMYFSTQYVAFRERMTNEPIFLYGQNTFRFVIAVLYKLGITKTVPVNTIQNFVEIYGYDTNVYTGLSYYAMDFGMWWAYVVEFLLGVLYGALYRKSFSKERTSVFSIVALSMLMYPLINQFFDDRYLSICSQWLKYMIFLWLITRNRILQNHHEDRSE